jgi:hypothetical protein
VSAPAYINSLKMRFARIEPGEFSMGSPPKEAAEKSYSSSRVWW